MTTFHGTRSADTEADGLELLESFDTIVSNGNLVARHTVHTEPTMFDASETLLIEGRYWLLRESGWVELPDDGSEAVEEFRRERGQPEELAFEYVRLLTIAQGGSAIGTETVLGQQTWRYDLVLDLELLSTASINEGTAALLDIFRTVGADEIPMTLWLDAQDRIVRIEQQVGDTLLAIWEFTNYNAALELTVPNVAPTS